MEEKRSNFVSEILDNLIRDSDAYTEQNKIRKVCEIGTMELVDFELKDVFTLMLRGAFEITPKVPASDNIEIKFEEGQTFIRPNFLPTEGYYPLMNFITLDHGNYKIRVFLASPQLLMAIFGSSTTVYDILQERYQLYRNVKAGMDPKEAEASFQSQFLSQALPYILPETLDFSISKTNPRNYE
jgi:hypothetical protein